MPHTEKTLSRRTLYQGRILTLTTDTALLENGATALREVVHHNGGVGVVPLFADGTVALVRQFRYPFGRELLEIPAGKRESQTEDPFLAIQRELEEECGLQAGVYVPLGEFYPSVGYCTEVIRLWAAFGLCQTHAHPDEDEFLDLVRLPLRQAVDLVMAGDVPDGKTIAALLKVQRLLDAGAPLAGVTPAGQPVSGWPFAAQP